MNKPVVYVVHSVDVEGPMTEELEATFERMRGYGLPLEITPCRETLMAIQSGHFNKIDSELLGNLKRVFNKHSLAYLEDWSQIDSMLERVTSNQFRLKYCDSSDNPYVYSWFIYDHHHNFKTNPRFHDVGTSNIFDHYQKGILKDNSIDGVYFHYHHVAPSGCALESGTSWTENSTYEQIIAHRIIERSWYFSCFRAGLHIERNDMSHWLEQFVPFDFSARYHNQNDYQPGSDFDWRGCPSTWGAWNPCWYDYRREGNMKRTLFRSTDLWTYLSALSESEVQEAFTQAQTTGRAVLQYYNHDFRDMEYEIAQGYEVLKKVSKRYSNVEWKFVTALEAAKEYLGLSPENIVLDYTLEGSLLTVRSSNDIFGMQPFLAIKEDNKYFRDNFTAENNNTWCYRFRNLDHLQAFGVAASNKTGEFDIKVWKKNAKN